MMNMSESLDHRAIILAIHIRVGFAYGGKGDTQTVTAQKPCLVQVSPLPLCSIAV